MTDNDRELHVWTANPPQASRQKETHCTTKGSRSYARFSKTFMLCTSEIPLPCDSFFGLTIKVLDFEREELMPSKCCLRADLDCESGAFAVSRTLLVATEERSPSRSLGRTQVFGVKSNCFGKSWLNVFR